eukprot:s706_g13.t1
MFTHGPFVGLTRTCKESSWTIKYINSFIRSQGVGEWTSFVLFRNAATGRHSDSHNLAGSTIKTTSFGNFTGGGLWLQGDPPKGVPAGVELGWEFCAPEQEHQEGTVEEGGRLAALTAWCTAAAVTYLSDDFPVGRASSSVALFEIGSYQKTLEVTNMDYLVAEPVGYDLASGEQWDPQVVQQTVRDLLPAVLWVHVVEIGKVLPSILSYLYEQVDSGRQLVLEAPPDHPCWDSYAVKELLERYMERWQARMDEPDLLRVNNFHIDGPKFDPNATVPEFLNYMVKHQENLDKTEDQTPRVGGEAITFEGASKITPEVRSSLKRLHQNLGHPSNTDLARHLRLAGADPSVVEATKKIR